MAKRCNPRWTWKSASPTLRTALALGLLVVVGCGVMYAQEVLGRKPIRELIAEEDADGDNLAREAFPDGAALKTDPELERLVKRAEQFARDGRYDLAAVLWQKVLDESGDTLMTRDGRHYTSLAAEVERTLSRLSPEALKLYRTSADGEANALLASIQHGADEEEALNKIVRRYFVSSLGDDAAYRLGCMALDRHDFVGASRLFQQILEQHPDPSMPRADILLRHAVASARVGDKKAAEAALASFEADNGPRPPRSALAAIKSYIAQAGTAPADVAASRNWQMALGNASRTGYMPSLPPSAAEADLAELWAQEFDLLLPTQANQPVAHRTHVFIGPAVLSARAYPNLPQQQLETRESLVSAWKEKGWFPTSQLLFDGDANQRRVYVKTATRLLCYDASGVGDHLVWRTAWQNSYQPDANTQMLMQFQGQVASAGTPRTLTEILHFGDRIHNSVSIAGDLIFNLEGERYSDNGSRLDSNAAQIQRGWTYGQVPRRARRNFLAAYNVHSGKAVWHRSADDDAEKSSGDEKGATDIGFMAAPTPYGNLLLVPVTDGGAMWLYALSQADGSTVWKSYLCDEPQGGTNHWATVGLAVDGRDAYVSCGTGAVFAVDAVSGVIRWAIRYQRHGENDPVFQNVYGLQNARKVFKGWQDDVVIPYGRLLVVLPSDSDRIFAVDRRTGDFQWESPRTSPLDNREALYALGMVGRHLFVAGRDVVRKYDVPSGRLVGERVINELPRQADALSFGRGCLTEEAIYLPVKDSVLKLSTADLSDISQVGVSNVSGDPVGNLFTDGEKLWVAGASRVYALTNFDRRMDELSKRISAGDATAQLIRMRMQFSRGELDGAVEDLRGVYRLHLAQNRLTAARSLVEGIHELQLTASRPLTALRLVADAFIDQQGAAVVFSGEGEGAETIDEVNRRKTEIIYSALATIRNKKIKESPATILKLAPAMNERYLLESARKTLAHVATPADADILKQAVRSGDERRVTLAADALARSQAPDAKEVLQELVESPSERLRLAAASGLLNMGDRDGLALLVELLDAKDDTIGSQASALLRQATGKVVVYSPSDPELRKQGIAQWKSWLEQEGATAKLNFPVGGRSHYFGRTLICYQSSGQVIELDENQRERWTATIQGVWSGRGLPNGHRLLAVYRPQPKILEYDDQGKLVWSLEGLPGQVFNVERLENGNTLVACCDSQQVVEYDRAKKVVWRATIEGRPMDAKKLDNGNVLVALSQAGRVAEYAINDKGEAELVWSVDGLRSAVSVQRLENGNTLVACMNAGDGGTGLVVEIDPNKQHVWKMDRLSNPYHVQRLENGNTLITELTRIQEVDANKKVIWNYQPQGKTGSSSAHRF